VTEYADCVICGGEITGDHEAELLDSSDDLVHADCHPSETREADQGTLGGFGA
jgi:hypothetical protein